MTSAELAARAAAIKAEWERKAAEGDPKAKRLLRECYPDETAAVEAAADVLAQPAPAHWADREESER